jgi:hypothetical protein
MDLAEQLTVGRIETLERGNSLGVMPFATPKESAFKRQNRLNAIRKVLDGHCTLAAAGTPMPLQALEPWRQGEWLRVTGTTCLLIEIAGPT